MALYNIGGASTDSAHGGRKGGREGEREREAATAIGERGERGRGREDGREEEKGGRWGE